MPRQPTAQLRTAYVDGVLYVPVDDVAAMLLDVAAKVEPHPDMNAADMLRSMARGLAARPD